MNTCTACGRPSATALVESSHLTSEGVVRYIRCACGNRWIEQAQLVLVTPLSAVRHQAV
jgi:DNA-directed RNA polymerase subunit M/transcription elongation factor TFIIS